MKFQEENFSQETSFFCGSLKYWSLICERSMLLWSFIRLWAGLGWKDPLSPQLLENATEKNPKGTVKAVCADVPFLEHDGGSCILFLEGSENVIGQWHYSISAGGMTLDLTVLQHLGLTLFRVKSSAPVFSFLIMEHYAATLYFSAVSDTRVLMVSFQTLLILQRRPCWTNGELCFLLHLVFSSECLVIFTLC